MHVSQTSFATGIGLYCRLVERRSAVWGVRSQVEFFIASRTTMRDTPGLTYAF